jgi:hypothetical protein
MKIKPKEWLSINLKKKKSYYCTVLHITVIYIYYKFIYEIL